MIDLGKLIWVHLISSFIWIRFGIKIWKSVASSMHLNCLKMKLLCELIAERWGVHRGGPSLSHPVLQPRGQREHQEVLRPHPEGAPRRETWVSARTSKKRFSKGTFIYDVRKNSSNTPFEDAVSIMACSLQIPKKASYIGVPSALPPIYASVHLVSCHRFISRSLTL